jgi:hypothetical protein
MQTLHIHAGAGFAAPQHNADIETLGATIKHILCAAQKILIPLKPSWPRSRGTRIHASVAL